MTTPGRPSTLDVIKAVDEVVERTIRPRAARSTLSRPSPPRR